MPKEWLVEGIFACGELSVVYGAPSSGKSALVGDMAFHVAAGREWNGHRVKEGLVVFVATERAGTTKRRLQAIGQDLNVEEPMIAVLDTSLDLRSSDTDARVLIAAIHEKAAQSGAEAVWVIIDTKARVLGGGNTNDAAAISQFVGNCELIQRSLRAHVTVIDHSSKGAKTVIKGDNGLEAAADTSFLIAKRNGRFTMSVGSKRPNDDAGDLSLTFDLARYVLSTDEHGTELETVRVIVGEQSVSTTLIRQPLTPQQRDIWLLIKDLAGEHGEVSAGRLKQELSERKLLSVAAEAQRKAIARATARLVELGWIVEQGHLILLTQEGRGA